MTGVRALAIDPQGYRHNHLHNPELPWQETNCYVDVWIELIHALGFDVEACLSFTLETDFEQDQWTFFKPPLQDLRKLYGLRVEELILWRSLPDQCAAQLEAGNLPLVEVDAYYLPDTAATDYQRNHVKTSVAINEIDQQEERLGYFHNTGYHHLSGSDFRGLFRLDRDSPPDYLAPYCEIVKTQTLAATPPGPDQVLALLKQHAAQRPGTNPFDRYAGALDEHLDWIGSGGLETYHAYVFASLRQCGAAFDLAARHLLWLENAGGAQLAPAASAFTEISATCKLLLLKLARLASGKPKPDLSGQLRSMSEAWTQGFQRLDAELDRHG